MSTGKQHRIGTAFDLLVCPHLLDLVHDAVDDHGITHIVWVCDKQKERTLVHPLDRSPKDECHGEQEGRECGEALQEFGCERNEHLETGAKGMGKTARERLPAHHSRCCQGAVVLWVE